MFSIEVNLIMINTILTVAVQQVDFSRAAIKPKWHCD